MSTEERIERLKRVVREQIALRDWLVNVGWEDAREAGEAALAHERTIQKYERLISRLEARL